MNLNEGSERKMGTRHVRLYVKPRYSGADVSLYFHTRAHVTVKYSRSNSRVKSWVSVISLGGGSEM